MSALDDLLRKDLNDYTALELAVMYLYGDHSADGEKAVDELAALRSRVAELEAYADKLAEGLPMLPKDIENIKAANWALAQRMAELGAAARCEANGCNEPKTCFHYCDKHHREICLRIF